MNRLQKLVISKNDLISVIDEGGWFQRLKRSLMDLLAIPKLDSMCPLKTIQLTLKTHLSELIHCFWFMTKLLWGCCRVPLDPRSVCHH